MGVDPRCSKTRCCKAEFPVILFLFEVAMIVLYAFILRYPAEGSPISYTTSSPATPVSYTELSRYYSTFQDIHVMVFVGMGFIVVFLKRYSFTAVSINFCIAAVVIQWALIVRAFIENSGLYPPFVITIQKIIQADYVALSVLISFGALLGNASPVQVLVMALIHVPLNLVNEYIIIQRFSAIDVGGALRLHAFGAYFGLGCSFVLFKRPMRKHDYGGSNYNSDTTAMVGTLFLWVFFPSFNSALATDDGAYRAVINTYLSLASSTVTAFFMHLATKPVDKLKMYYIQHATLAGGVGIACLADLQTQPYGALIIGMLSALISVFGFSVLQDAIGKIRIFDTCGVHNLHGMPGVFSGICCVVASYLAQDLGGTWPYGYSLSKIFPQRSVIFAPRTGQEQALLQLAAIGVTMGIAIGGGLLAGAILRIPMWDTPKTEDYYNDEFNYELPTDESAYIMQPAPPYELQTSY